MQLRWEVGDAEHLPYADAEFDVGDLLRRRDVRPAPPGGRRRAGPRGPPRRPDRAAQLDAGRLHRPDVRHHEALRPAAAARRPAAPAVGRRGARPRAARRPRHRRDRGDQRRCRCRCSRTARRSATSSSAPTGRPSRSTAPWPTTRRARPSSTRPAHGDDVGDGDGVGVPAAHRRRQRPRPGAELRPWSDPATRRHLCCVDRRHRRRQGDDASAVVGSSALGRGGTVTVGHAQSTRARLVGPARLAPRLESGLGQLAGRLARPR